MNLTKKLVAAVTTAATLGGITLAITSTPATAAPSCAGAGYLCFLDYGSGVYGNVSGNNPWWGAFAGGWNDRADWFRNDGRSCNVKLYKDVNYNDGSWFPEERLLYRGSETTWSNVVSSNHWWFPSGASCA